VDGFPSTCAPEAHWKIRAKKFQALEKSRPKLPIIGNLRLKSSNPWKKRTKNFQPLETAEAIHERTQNDEFEGT
jgi:hypothetical protein